MEELFSLKNKVIVITGAGKGIGSILAEELLKKFAIVYAIDKAFPKNNQKQDYFKKKCDITNKIQLEKTKADLRLKYEWN